MRSTLDRQSNGLVSCTHSIAALFALVAQLCLEHRFVVWEASADEKQLIDDVERALEENFLERLEELGREILEGGNPQRPFEPDLRLAGQTPKEFRERAGGAMVAANGPARGHCLLEFRRCIRAGYAGPIIASEGDRWFQYLWVLRDVIDNLMELFAVKSLGAAGDLPR